MIYIASPYSVVPKEYYEAGMTQGLLEFKMQRLMEDRYHSAMKYVVQRIAAKDAYFSPILYSHEMAKNYQLPKTFEFWAALNHKFMDACSEVHVLQMYAWEDSLGIKDEIFYAIKKGIPIKYVEWEG